MARKKTQRKSEYQGFPNCIDPSTLSEPGIKSHFPNPDAPLTLELGCGKAEFSYELSERFPERNYLGVDLKADRLWRPAKEALAAGRTNLAFLCTDLRNIAQYVQENEADEIWITFPDPFPKNRQAKHRMINPNFLVLYEKILRPSGHLFFKTDNLPLFQYALEVFVSQGNIKFHELSFDLHGKNEIADTAKVKTTYEKKFLEMGLSINYINTSFLGTK